MFRAPLGAYLAGFGALSSLIAFPLDDYWHTLYGVDVTLWAPFHVMIIGGVVLVGLGSAFTFAAATNAANDRGDIVNTRIGTVGIVVALASFLSLLFLYLGDTLKPSGVVPTPFGSIEVYAALVASFGAFVLAMAARAFFWNGAATSVAVTYWILRQAALWFVPWSTDLMVHLEGQTYRSTAPPFSVAPYAMPSWLILAAVLVDLAVWLARRRGVSPTWPVLLALAVGFTLIGLVDLPWVKPLADRYSLYLGMGTVIASLPPIAPVAVVTGWLGIGTGRALAEVRR